MSPWKPATAPALRRHTGNAYEQLAARYLCEQGLELIASNYFCRLGEIDLIMKHGDTLVFVEVRYRQHADFMDPLESITVSKQRRLIRCAQVYLKQHGLSNRLACRIDVVGITDRPTGPGFDWIPNAIQPGG